MKNLFRILFLVSPLFAFAAEYQPYEWEKNRSRFKLTAEEEALSELVLKSHTQYDYVLENDQLVMYATVHRIIFVNNSEAVQKHNRIYIPMHNTIDLVELKARSISKSGKVVLFDKSNLKEIKEEESGDAYRIFAIEGVEIGSEIEYYYVKKRTADLYERSFLQNDVPIKESSFVLSCPGHLEFDFKSYFGFPDVKSEVKDEKNIYTTSMKDIPALKNEPFAYSDAHRMRIEFKLAYNRGGRSQARLYTWDDAAKIFYKMITELSKDEEKALEKFIKTIDDKPSSDQAQRIKNIEDKIKSSIQVNAESVDEALKKIESIVKYKVASREGITKLFIALFSKLGIDNQLVITCNRQNVKFDPAFDSWNYLGDYLLYFPSTKGFMAPYHIETRYPLVPAELTAHNGLFIEPFTVGEVKSALASVHEIPEADYKVNTDDLDIAVTFNEDASSNQIRMKRDFSGYNSAFVLPYFELMTQEQLLSMVEELTKQTAPDPQIKTWTAKPSDKKDKFTIDVDFQSSHFLEKAGPRILFKVGELIGPQTEMYRDDKRVLDIENDFNRGYDRVIVVNLPAGYTIKNPDDLKFDVVYTDKDETPFLFKSDYTLQGSTLKITIGEYYKRIYAPVARYEDFRKVINAAADFNKVTLVLEKKK